MRMTRRSLLLIATLASAGSAAAAGLELNAPAWTEANLRASLDPSDTLQVEQGSNMRLRVSADEEGSVALVLVNAESRAKIVVPTRAGTGNRISRGTEMLFPDLLSGETLYANMPVGRSTVYVLESRDQLDLPGSYPVDAKWEPVEAVSARLAAALARQSDQRLAMRRLPIQVVSPAMKDFVSTDDFVNFFDIGTRDVKNAERGIRIQFKTNSSELTELDVKQLDAIAKGMNSSELRGFPFMIEGHTDDVGTDEYNMSLSDRRAASVWRYLGAQGVGTSRLAKSAMGKSGPAMKGTSDEARAANRRVVIRRVDK